MGAICKGKLILWRMGDGGGSMAKKKPSTLPKTTATPAPVAEAGSGSGPKPVQTSKLPPKLGGEVWMYNLRRTALPEVVNPPKEKDAAQWEWWAVHFPSRRCAPVKSDDRLEALRVMKQYARGVDELGLMPPPKVKLMRGGARASAREGKGGKSGPAKAGTTKPGGGAPANRMGYTRVPEGLDFDRGMAHVFPVERLTREFERLLHASEPVYDKEGNEVGERPAFAVQFQTLKSLAEWSVGRPREKEKKVDSKPVLSIADMRRKMMASPEYRAAIMEMVTDCEKEAQRAAGPVKPVGAVKVP